MSRICEGVNGTEGAERYYIHWTADEVWRRERATPIAAAFEYWTTCRAGEALPREDAIDDRRLGKLGWRLRKVDVRSTWVGSWAVVVTGGEDLFAFRRFPALGGFERDCLLRDLVACILERRPLYVTARIAEGEYGYGQREVILPAIGDGDRIAWIYMIAVHDDESRDALAEVGREIGGT